MVLAGGVEGRFTEEDVTKPAPFYLIHNRIITESVSFVKESSFTR